MSNATTPARYAARLLNKVVCPHCWEPFAPEDVLWISEHPEMTGDARLGRDQPGRFLPSRFTLRGEATDAKGLACRELACPNCHLGIPRGVLEQEPLFVSILGGPGSGKSYFLATSTWKLREVLPHSFGVAFGDADPASNARLNEWEANLFLNPQPERLHPALGLVDKTELEGHIYDSVTFGQHVVKYARPYLFSFRPVDPHPRAGTTALGRMLCLYDNAGEHFQPGTDTAANPVTRHLALAGALIFVFDPTQDRRVRDAAGLPSGGSERVGRQETILAEAASRIRRHVGLPQDARHNRPLIVVLSKFDAWGHLLGYAPADEPWRPAPGEAIRGLDVGEVERVSAGLRALLLRYCPETVAAAESLSEEVYYVPISAMGQGVETLPESGVPGVRPGRLRPYWVTVPFLLALNRVLPGLIFRLVRKPRP